MSKQSPMHWSQIRASLPTTPAIPNTSLRSLPQNEHVPAICSTIRRGSSMRPVFARKIPAPDAPHNHKNPRRVATGKL
jgi:hypothetical protein